MILKELYCIEVNLFLFRINSLSIGFVVFLRNIRMMFQLLIFDTILKYFFF